MQKKNPLQDKYFKLTRADDENVARELQPKPQELEEINKILKIPDFMTLTQEQENLIFKFRYSLTKNNKALVKFL